MAKRNDYTVKEKKPLFSGRKNKSGKNTRIGTEVTYSDGGKQTLLTPAGKGTKYAVELREKLRITNDGIIKTDDKGKPLSLTKEQRSYRAGYLDAQKDAAKAFNSREAKKAAKAEAKAAKEAAKLSKVAAKIAAKQPKTKANGDSRGVFTGVEKIL